MKQERAFVLRSITIEQERRIILSSIITACQENEVVDKTGLELFWAAVKILEEFGMKDEVIIAPDLETMRGNRRCQILSTPLVHNECERSGEAYFRLTISPIEWFGNTVKPALSIDSIVWREDNKLPELTGESYSVSRYGEVIKPDGVSCHGHEIGWVREVLEHIRTSLENDKGIDFDDLMISKDKHYVPRR